MAVRIWKMSYGMNSEVSIAAETFDQALEKGKEYLDEVFRHDPIKDNKMIWGLVIEASAQVV